MAPQSQENNPGPNQGTLPSNSPVSEIIASDAVALLQFQHGSNLADISFLEKSLHALLLGETRMLFASQTSLGRTLSVAIPAEGLEQALKKVSDSLSQDPAANEISVNATAPDFAVLTVYGEAMRERPGTAARVFNTLGRNGVNIVAIAQDSSERDISFVIPLRDRKKALQALEEAFRLSLRKSIHLFVAGVGQIGSGLLRQLRELHSELLTRGIQIKLCGLSNSRKMLFSSDGIDLSRWEELFSKQAHGSSVEEFIHGVRELNLPNSIFVDCTATDSFPSYYESLLRHSISVVTPNKRGNASTFKQYQKLKSATQAGLAKFFYETTVGAGLPIIGTLHDLVASGDEIIRIEAVLSGTLSYIFNSFDPAIPFSRVVREAREKGYTEPDPRDDLSGKDFGRKLLILGREMGLALHEQDVHIQSLVPEDCAACKTPEEFLQALAAHDETFAQLLQKASQEKKVLRYIGRIEAGKAQVELQSVDESHPFYALSGSDNIVSFTTKRYFHRPLVVKGPGAGVEVTAAGVLADILRVASYLS